MKRALIITYYWPPSGGSGVQRWVKFSKYLPSQGWQPVIYTPENPEYPSIDKSLEADVPPEAEVIRRHITEVYGIYRSLTGTKKGGGEVNPINNQKKSFKQKLMLAIRGNFFIPDPRITWVRPSVKFLKNYLKEHPVDVIVSTGPPHSMHLIARKLSLSTGIPWVADFRDPWTKMFYFKHLSLGKRATRKHEKLEKQVLDDATVVVAVSPLVQEEFQQMTSTPVELITNGFDPDDFEQVVEEDGFFNITHTGLFASDGDPTVLWKVLGDKCATDAEFDKMLRIRLAGKNDTGIISSIKEAGLGGHLVDLGYLPHQTVVREQKNATILMLPLRKEPEYKATLPGKLFEYLAASKPVLGIGQTDGAMARILSDAKAGETFGWEDEKGMALFIDKIWKDFSSGKESLCDGDINKYSRKATTERMAALFDKICENKK